MTPDRAPDAAARAPKGVLGRQPRLGGAPGSGPSHLATGLHDIPDASRACVGAIIVGVRWIGAVLVMVAVTLAGCGDGSTSTITQDAEQTGGGANAPGDAAATLVFDDDLCRNEGSVTHDGVAWTLADGMPTAWRTLGRVDGTLVVSEQPELATFIADDGTELVVTTGATTAECLGWDDDEAQPGPVEQIDRLSCSPSTVAETRVADTGQTPADVMAEVLDDVASVEAGRPLWWWGLNATGEVVVGIALGDALGADYQVWTCAD